MLNKCQLFFIQACQDAGIELSNYILARRHGLSNQKKIEKTQTNKIVPSSKTKLNSNEVLISKILDKYPDFDPSWNDDVKKSWIDSLTKLYDSLK